MLAVQAAAALALAGVNAYLAGGALGWWRVFGVDIGVRA
jgi:rhodanese-related sulfurtransferase